VEERAVWVDILKSLKDQGYWILAAERSTGTIVLKVKEPQP
jgi:hypothetical protein